MTTPLTLDITDRDRAVYTERLAGWLPDRLFDVHTHVWLKRFKPARPAGAPARSVSWPSRVASENPIEHLLATYEALLPGRRVTPLIFSTAGKNLDEANAYIREAARRTGVPALLFSDPAWSGAETVHRVREGGFLGVKSYLSLAPAYLPTGEIRIFDFFTPDQLAALDRCAAIVMLHIPRDARLRDSVNLAQLLEIEARYPRLQVIVAHVGRAYCDEDVGEAFQALAGTRRLNFDISANTNARVFRRLLEAVGPRRVLFGTDLPILRMRTRRICENGRYINLVPRGLYGDVSGDPHLREVSGAEAEALTFFLYEELLAFREASEAAGLDRAGLEAVFSGNAEAMLERARVGLAGAGPAEPEGGAR